MTMTTFSHEHRIPVRVSFVTSGKNRISAIAEQVRADWNRRKTERMLEGLPQDIRKDIGWPTTAGK